MGVVLVSLFFAKLRRRSSTQGLQPESVRRERERQTEVKLKQNQQRAWDARAVAAWDASLAHLKSSSNDVRPFSEALSTFTVRTSSWQMSAMAASVSFILSPSFAKSITTRR